MLIQVGIVYVIFEKKGVPINSLTTGYSEISMKPCIGSMIRVSFSPGFLFGTFFNLVRPSRFFNIFLNNHSNVLSNGQK